jgi:hypothetical protein
MMFTLRAMKTHTLANTLGFVDVELRHIGRRRNAAAIRLFNLIYPAPTGTRYEQIVRLKLLPRTAA